MTLIKIMEMDALLVVKLKLTTLVQEDQSLHKTLVNNVKMEPLLILMLLLVLQFEEMAENMKLKNEKMEI